MVKRPTQIRHLNEVCIHAACPCCMCAHAVFRAMPVFALSGHSRQNCGPSFYRCIPCHLWPLCAQECVIPLKNWNIKRWPSTQQFTSRRRISRSESIRSASFRPCFLELCCFNSAVSRVHVWFGKPAPLACCRTGAYDAGQIILVATGSCMLLVSGALLMVLCALCVKRYRRRSAVQRTAGPTEAVNGALQPRMQPKFPHEGQQDSRTASQGHAYSPNAHTSASGVGRPQCHQCHGVSCHLSPVPPRLHCATTAIYDPILLQPQAWRPA